VTALAMPDTPYALQVPRGHTRSRLAIIAAIADRLAKGELVKEASEAEGISSQIVWKWTEADPSLGELYARARVNQAHALAEEAVRLADDESIPADSRRVRVDTRKWFTSKIAPKLYGDEKHHTVSISVAGLHLDALKQPAQATARLAAPAESDAEPVEVLPADDGEQ